MRPNTNERAKGRNIPPSSLILYCSLFLNTRSIVPASVTDGDGGMLELIGTLLVVVTAPDIVMVAVGDDDVAGGYHMKHSVGAQ